MSEKLPATEIEMELAFLPKWLPPEIVGVTPVRVTDIYISETDDLLSKLRLRQKGGSYEMTKKVVMNPDDLSVQQEHNLPLTEDEFNKLSAVVSREVVKDRYLFDVHGRQVEIDLFRGMLTGFGLVEFEFTSEAEKAAFAPPEFCGANVTQEDFVAGAYLAGKTYDDIAHELDRFGYNPIYYED